jgi:hypothetical protein
MAGAPALDAIALQGGVKEPHRIGFLAYALNHVMICQGG